MGTKVADAYVKNQAHKSADAQAVGIVKKDVQFLAGVIKFATWGGQYCHLTMFYNVQPIMGSSPAPANLSWSKPKLFKILPTCQFLSWFCLMFDNNKLHPLQVIPLTANGYNLASDWHKDIECYNRETVNGAR